MIPLSTRMRPETIDEFLGQEHFLYKGSLLYESIRKKTFENAIFFGPSGTGKTTLARIIAKEMDGEFYEVNATTTGTKELREIIQKAEANYYGLLQKRTYVYVDEIHRWNKLQQDALLKALEDGVIKMIGSTTENPYFSINNAVLSRVRAIYEFKRHTTETVNEILIKALNTKRKGLADQGLSWDEDAIMAIADASSGDARIALDTLGFIAENIAEGRRIDKTLVKEAMPRQMAFFDKGEDRYDLLSALQKSIRGSDPDAAVHYLARLVEEGGDIVMIGRRLLVMASEDIGMAYPNAISVVTSCIQASQMVGLPEARINLAQAVIFLAACPKSNSACVAIDSAVSDLKMRRVGSVPAHLKDSHYAGAKDRGSGIGYKYPHAYGGYVKQQYLPDDLFKEGVTYYNPTENGKEIAFKRFLEGLKCGK